MYLKKTECYRVATFKAIKTAWAKANLADFWEKNSMNQKLKKQCLTSITN